ncbi:MAG: hypothetical protein JWR51_3441 [Devosia sp.]|uniref:hypothetical protein n=1 Tax=Devosia sp. TaxID=1871048 RepID=UPI00262226FB|nr:hypothetical protein [Devosia sp.]MDB5530338.1 hypothetical protein [Devosia sp.]
MSILDEFPFPIDKEPAQKLVRVMAALYRSESAAVFLVAPLGVDRFSITPNANPLGLWYELMDKLAAAGSVRRAVEECIRQHSNNPERPFLEELLAGQQVVSNPGQKVRDGQIEDAIARRVQNAKILMDRDVPELKVHLVRHDATNPGIVHVLAAHHRDNHPNFLERIAVLSVPRRSGVAREDELLAAFLGEVPRDIDSWKRGSLTWDLGSPEREALWLISKQVEEYLDEKSPVLLEATIDVPGVSEIRERRMVTALAQFCATKAIAPDRLQIFVIYHDSRDGADRSKPLRKKLSGPWSSEKRPPGGGACLNLDDLRRGELNDWSVALEKAWQVGAGKLTRGVAVAFKKNQMPMRSAEDCVEPLLNRAISGQL